MDVTDEVQEKDTTVFFVTTVCEPTDQDIKDILNIGEDGTDCDDDDNRIKDDEDDDDNVKDETVDDDYFEDDVKNETDDDDDVDDSKHEEELVYVNSDKNINKNESDTDNIDIMVDLLDYDENNIESEDGNEDDLEDDVDDSNDDEDEDKDDNDDQDVEDASGVDEVVNNKESTYNNFSKNSLEQEIFTGNNNLIITENDSENSLTSNILIKETNSDNSNSDSYLPSFTSEMNSHYETSTTDIFKHECSDDEETVDYSNSSVEFIQRYLQEASQNQTCELTLPEDFIAGTDSVAQNSEQSTLCDNLQETCGYSFTKVKRKKYSSKKRKYPCDICENSFSDSSKLKRHKRFFHSSKEKNTEREYIFKCDICGRKFKYISNLKRHIQWHKGQPRHEKNSEGKYNWECTACVKTFPDKHSLKAHLRVHTGERPFKCDECDATFTQSTHRYKHMKYSCKNVPITERVSNKIKDLPCPVCNALFSNKTDLKRHMVIHTGERNFSCHICRHTFGRISTLNRHIRRHKNDVNKPFKCSHCLKRFFVMKGCKKHELKCSMGLMCK